MKNRFTLFSMAVFLGIAACNNPQTKPAAKDPQVSFRDEKYRNCDMANKFLASGEEVFFDSDTMCSTMHAYIPVVAAANASVSDSINARIVQVFSNYTDQSVPCKTIDDIQPSFNRIANQEGFDISIMGSVITNSNGYLALCFESEYYSFGAAHPLAEYDTRNFDIETGKLISLNDCLKPDALTKLVGIVEKHFKSEYGDEDQHQAGEEEEDGKYLSMPSGLDDEPFKLPADFAFTDKGLAFYFDMYENGPGVNGIIIITVAYSELNECINPESLVGKWIAALPR